MNTFQNIVTIGAAFAAVANAACKVDRPQDCIDFEDMNQAVIDHAADYTWRFYSITTADDYKLRLFRFEGDETGASIPDQWTMGPVLLINTATRDCRSWFTESNDADMDAIPKMLFDAGYDVWLGCKRGTEYSHEHSSPFDAEDEDSPPFSMLSHTDEEKKDFWDFNTGTIG